MLVMDWLVKLYAEGAVIALTIHLYSGDEVNTLSVDSAYRRVEELPWLLYPVL
jgi:hypothetical protein